ncbi:hypothetical protein GCM10018966_096090 [Streptomyces yanii]
MQLRRFTILQFADGEAHGLASTAAEAELLGIATPPTARKAAAIEATAHRVVFLAIVSPTSE